jgi:hypothetical protein
MQDQRGDAPAAADGESDHAAAEQLPLVATAQAEAELEPELAAASRCCRILAYGDSLTAGYYNRGTAFSPYSDALAPLLCAAAAAGGGAGGGGSPEQKKPPPVTVDV